MAKPDMSKIAHPQRLEKCTKGAKSMAQKVADRLPEGQLVIRSGCEGKVFFALWQVNGSVKSVDSALLEGLSVDYDGVSKFVVKK